MSGASRLGAAAAGVLLGLVLAEGVLRALETEERFAVWPPGLVRHLRPDPAHVPGVSEDAFLEIGRLGVRGPPLPDDTDALRFLVLGGAGAAGTWLDDRKTWPQEAARLLRNASGRTVWMGGAARDGFTTRDHVVQAPRLLEDLPVVDGVLLLAGAEDLLLRLAEGDAHDPDRLARPGAEARQLDHAFARGPHRRSGAPRVAAAFAALAGRLAAPPPGPPDASGAVLGPLRARRRAAEPHRDALPSLDAALDAYRRHVLRVDAAVRAAGARLVLLTPAALWREALPPRAEALLWMGAGPREDVYYASGALARGLAAYAAVLRGLCAPERPCVDLAAALDGAEGAFFDDLHLTEAGARLAARAVASGLAAHLAPAPAEAPGGAP